NSQVKDNKINLLVQQYEQFVISEDESIDSAFARFNTIITSLKALDEGYSSKNYVRKFLRALHPKLRAKVMAIEESKGLTSLSLDELIGNLKAKKESSDEGCLTSGSKDEEYVMAVKDFKKFFKRRDPNHLIGECPKPPKDKNQRTFVGGSWSDSSEENDEKFQDETCLVAQAPNEGFAAALAVLVTGASQSRQHESHHRFFPVDTSLIHIESRKSPTKSLFDVGSSRISIFTVNT
ncbi:hypothetical protein Tco_0523272, partial [Tanacetum coccineum]